MKNTFGNNVTVTIFGESHGEAIGAVLDGMAPGIPIDNEFLEHMLSLRRPSGKISTARREPDPVQIISGVFEGVTTGTPIAIIIPNTAKKSADYDELKTVARPSHADYAAFCKYHGFNDYRGGGHFSGRITAALVAAGAVALSALKNKGITVGTHISRIGEICDRPFGDLDADIAQLQTLHFPVLDEQRSKEMLAKIESAAAEGDSVGGILETVVKGVPAGVGEPWFDTLEGLLSHILFSIPAVKGVQFGDGFGFADQTGSEANDEFCVENGEIKTSSNKNGGINGGISNGMPIVFSCAVKPTPSIYKEQNTVDFAEKTERKLQIKGRHDPAIIHRARAVVDAAAAIALCDALSGRFGTDWLKG